jgi:2-polyprenyl-3-methyl-5-hydroxy-6-metoxy-1,4-benzoquinol methylase
MTRSTNAFGGIVRGLGRRLRRPVAPPEAEAEPQSGPPADPPPQGPTRRRIASVAEMHATIAALRQRFSQDSVGFGAAVSELELAPPPVCTEMRALDPFSEDYAQRAFALMAELRGVKGFDARRDERIGHSLAGRDLWTGLSPWDHRSPLFLAEMFECYATMLRQLGAPAGARVLEYGPGSGQFLLFLARIGYRCHAVDIEPEYLRVIGRQARTMGLEVRTQRGLFGQGFEGERFDVIVFFEAFHHVRDFMGLLRHLRTRLNPGGRLILCGEPLLPDGMVDGPVPYPWGPRLDGLSIEAIQRGWTELGYQTGFLINALLRAGWHPNLIPHHSTFRAHMIVSTVAGDPDDAP